MGQMRTLDEFADQYFRDRPEETNDYLAEIFQEFAEDNDTRASLRVIARVQDCFVLFLTSSDRFPDSVEFLLTNPFIKFGNQFIKL